MADEINSGWTTERWLALIAVIFSGISGLISTCNNTKLQVVENQQTVHSQKTEEVKEALDASSAIRDKKLDRIDKTTAKTEATVADTVGPTLWASYRYLREVANDDPTPSNLQKAADAKAAYEKYRASKQNP